MVESKVKTEASGGATKDKDKEGEDKKKVYNFNKGSNRVTTSNIGKFEGKVDALKGFYYD